MSTPKIQTKFLLQHQWLPLDEWTEDHREMSNCSKMILVPKKWAQE